MGRLQGNRGLVKQVEPQLKEILEHEGVEPSDCPWLLPIFICEELQSPRIFPVFFDPRDVATTWVKAGRPKDTIPESLKVMDIRSFVAMLRKADNPWHLVQFIGSPEGIELVIEEQT